LTTAYKYGDPDRRLNVVILSDGMTEQKERALLIDMIGRRPSHARVFCIGVGNEINRPLLEQMAEDSGGLAAFISVGKERHDVNCCNHPTHNGSLHYYKPCRPVSRPWQPLDMVCCSAARQPAAGLGSGQSQVTFGT
jgi:hypothetical protein